MAGPYFSVPFATSGDVTPVPVALQPDGSISYSLGWGPDYEKADTEPGYKPVSRSSSNALFGDITAAIKDIQDFGVPTYYPAAAPYAINSLVRHLNKVWRSGIANNNSVPGADANWIDTSVASLSTDGIGGSFSNLVGSATGLNALASYTIGEICLKNASGEQKVFNNVTISASTAVSGLNGIDSGAVTPLTWYSVWCISNGTVTGAVLTTNPGGPALPPGYTYKGFISWIRTDNSVNRLPLAFIQRGKNQQYTPGGGTNLAEMPKMLSGIQGNPTTPVWVAVPLASFFPPNVCAIYVSLYGSGAGTNIILAPSNTFGGVNAATNIPMVNISNGAANANLNNYLARIIPQSANIYYASNANVSHVSAFAWENI